MEDMQLMQAEFAQFGKDEIRASNRLIERWQLDTVAIDDIVSEALECIREVKPLSLASIQVMLMFRSYILLNWIYEGDNSYIELPEVHSRETAPDDWTAMAKVIQITCNKLGYNYEGVEKLGMLMAVQALKTSTGHSTCYCAARRATGLFIGEILPKIEFVD